jgi:3-oxoadipate enol-lactonase
METVRTILGDIYVDDQGDRAEPLALLWRSLFTDHSMWRCQIPALRAAGLRTLAVDPPGHGRSRGLDRVFTMDACAQAALQVLDAANVGGSVVVVGTSWGGMVSPRIALLAPDRVRAMVLFNTTAESAAPFDWARGALLTQTARDPRP